MSARLLPLLLLLALAMLTFWLDRAVRDDARHPSLRRHDPDYFVENFRITTYSREGRPESTLSARKMVHYPDDDSTELEAPVVVQTKADQPTMTLSADRGALSQDGDDVFLFGNVLVLREASADRPETRMHTTFLHLVRERSLVRTDREVTIAEEGRRISGRGMEYDNEKRRLVLHERVRGHFEPKKRN